MGKTILFTGDSITDGNRYRDEKDRGDLNHQMGHSYAYVVNALLGSLYPEKAFHFLNRGISGNRIIDLYGRMYEDIVALKPDIVSILAGVNDGPQAEHTYVATGAEKYGTLYRMMLIVEHEGVQSGSDVVLGIGVIVGLIGMGIPVGGQSGHRIRVGVSTVVYTCSGLGALSAGCRGVFPARSLGASGHTQNQGSSQQQCKQLFHSQPPSMAY